MDGTRQDRAVNVLDRCDLWNQRFACGFVDLSTKASSSSVFIDF